MVAEVNSLVASNPKDRDFLLIFFEICSEFFSGLATKIWLSPLKDLGSIIIIIKHLRVGKD